MIKEIKARFTGGVFEPLEKLDLDEGQEVVISIKQVSSVERTLKALKATAGAWKGTHDAEESKRNIYLNRFPDAQPDLRP